MLAVLLEFIHLNLHGYVPWRPANWSVKRLKLTQSGSAIPLRRLRDAALTDPIDPTAKLIKNRRAQENSGAHLTQDDLIWHRSVDHKKDAVVLPPR
jgi:hypothetical protein